MTGEQKELMIYFTVIASIMICLFSAQKCSVAEKQIICFQNTKDLGCYK